MKVAFVTEMGFNGVVPADHPNMRTEFAWMYALNADHYNINTFTTISNYDHVFVIFPKGRVYLDACGSKLINEINPVSGLLSANVVRVLKQQNKKVYYIQEGPHWLWTDYELADQINFYNMLLSCDAIFAHNSSDVDYYKGLFPTVPVHIMPTLMVVDSIKDLKPTTEDKSIVGGNFARWYGGFESFIVAQEFGVPIWGQTSHATREGEDQLIQHLPRVYWTDWMKQLSTFKYAVHLMPTAAAGTFSLNCAYFGIPCIGNAKVDTQNICHPDLSVDVHDIQRARLLAKQLQSDSVFYEHCSLEARKKYNQHYNVNQFIKKITHILNG